MYKIVPNPDNFHCTLTTKRWELRTYANEFIACFARKEVAEQIVEALETMHEITRGLRAHENPANYSTWYNPEREEKIFSFNGETVTFVWIPPGWFVMGNEEFGQRTVTLQNGFWMQTTPVTQGQWLAIMGHNPAHFIEMGLQSPIESVSWMDAKKFISEISSLGNFRLPTEAEWEYACRAGTTTKYYFGDDPAMLHQYAWFDQNSDSKTHPVGQLDPNSWGLYDTHGNVWEYCEDHWYDNCKDTSTDDSAWIDKEKSFYRVMRGGSWNSLARYCCSNFRSSIPIGVRYSHIGFRLVFTERE